MRFTLNTIRGKLYTEPPSLNKRVVHNRDNTDLKFLLLGINMAETKSIIIGAGRIASRKAKTLLQAGAELTVIAPQIKDDWLRDKISRGEIFYIESHYQEVFLDSYDFVIAATSDSKLNAIIAEHAKQKGKLWTVVSSAHMSRVIFPAMYNFDGLSIAIHSNGSDYRRSKSVRDDIASYLGKSSEMDEFLVFGFSRSDLPVSVSRQLNHITRKISTDVHRDVLILSTCRRWECYIAGRRARDVMRDIIFLMLKYGFDWDTNSPFMYFKNSSAAYHHLVRVLAGLDSPLIGETEIISQVRNAMNKYLSDNSYLSEIFKHSMLTGRKLRELCGLKPARTSWAKTIASFIARKLNGQSSPTILVLGLGSLSKSIVHKLSDALSNPAVKVYSQHANKTDVLDLGPSVQLDDLDRLYGHLDSASVLIIGTELTNELYGLGKWKPARKLLVVDLEGNNSVTFNRYSSFVEYHKAEDIVRNRPLEREQALAAAKAELKAMEQTLIWSETSRKSLDFPNKLIIGTRPSRLAMSQVDEFLKMLKLIQPAVEYKVVTIRTPCDRDKNTPLPVVSEDDFFTRDIDRALLSGRIDIAVHSAKDMPRKIHPHLSVAAITPSIARWEALISRSGLPLMKLPAGSIIGTSSQHRRDILKKLRPDLIAADIRGNVPERIERFKKGEYDALILACAGLVRLGLTDEITEVFSEDIFPPVPGQGSLALVVRSGDTQLRELLAPLDLADKRGLPWL